MEKQLELYDIVEINDGVVEGLSGCVVALDGIQYPQIGRVVVAVSEKLFLEQFSDNSEESRAEAVRIYSNFTEQTRGYATVAEEEDVDDTLYLAIPEEFVEFDDLGTMLCHAWADALF